MAKYKLKDLFSKEVHKQVLSKYIDNTEAAYAYNYLLSTGDLPDLVFLDVPEKELVSRQLVRYWRKIYIDNNGSQSKANNQLKEQRKLVQPSPTDDIGTKTYIPEISNRILCIGDLHEPYTHQDAYAFLEHVRDWYNPDTVVQIGDETDGHAISFHDSDPNLDSAGVELEKAKLGLEKLHKLFPNLLVCDSNHGSLIFRRAKHHGLPIQMIKKYREILFPEHKAQGWSWADAWVLNTPMGTVRFQHQVSGDLMLNASHERTSLVIGHHHSKFNVMYAASSSALYFGAHCGCLVDRKSLAFAYGKLVKDKPIMGCLVITDGCPQLIPMLVDSNNRWVGRKENK